MLLPCFSLWILKLLTIEAVNRIPQHLPDLRWASELDEAETFLAAERR